MPAVHDQALRADLAAADSAYWVTILRDGIRMRLFVEAMLTAYGECTNDVDARLAQLVGLRVRRLLLPALRVAEEELHDVRVPLARGAERVVAVDVGADAHGQRA